MVIFQVGHIDVNFEGKFEHRVSENWAHSTYDSTETVVYFPALNRLVREVDYSPPSIAEVKNEWSYTSIPFIFLRGVDRNKFVIVPVA